MAEQELEVKFFLNNSVILEKKLKSLGANLVQPRIFEMNLRFDTQEGELNRGGRVLRLRQDAKAFLTYKGPNTPQQGVSVRQEIEFSVSDFTAARHLIEALGYQVAIVYEKYRTTYMIGKVFIVIDELPFGDFVEIEGPDPASIQQIADKLELTWAVRCTDSYIGLFGKLREKRKLPFRDLTFSNFTQVQIKPDELGVTAADQLVGESGKAE